MKGKTLLINGFPLWHNYLSPTAANPSWHGLSPQSIMTAAITYSALATGPQHFEAFAEHFSLDISYSLHLWSKSFIFLPFSKVHNYYLQ